LKPAKNNLDPRGSSFRWAMARTHDRMSGVIIAGLILGAVGGTANVLFNPGSSATKRVQVEHGVVGAILSFIVVVFIAALYSIVRAPFEQLEGLLILLTESESKEQALVAALEEPLLRKEHREELRGMAESALLFVDAGRGISFDPSDLASLVSHFQELGPLVEEWNKGVVEWRQRNDALQERFDRALHEEGFDNPPWATGAFNKHFLEVKRRARESKLANPFTLEWHDFVDDFPNLIWFKDGTALVMADPESDLLNAGECKKRAQIFVDQILTWEETISYGDWQSHHKFDSVRGRLQEALKSRIRMHDYKRGAGCPRCPQP
jgi:hypothetical protein